MASSLITSWQIDGETMETVADFILWGAPKSLQMVIAAMKLKDACSLEEKVMTNQDSILKSRNWNKDCQEISITLDMEMTPLLWQKAKRN